MGQNDYQIALEILGDTDLKRFACCFLHCDRNKVDYEAAAADFGSASANSMRTMLYSALKKIKAASPGDDAGEDVSNPTTPTKAKSSPKKRATPSKQGSSRKRAKPLSEDPDAKHESTVKQEPQGQDEGPPMPELKEGDVDPFAPANDA